MENIFDTLTAYNILQDVFFIVFLLSTRKRENTPILIYFIHNLLITAPLRLVSTATESTGWYFDAVYFGHSIVVVAMPAVVINLLYSLQKRSLPKVYYLLWLLPLIKTVMVIADPGYDLESTFQDDWYLDLSVWAKMIFAVVLFVELVKYKREKVENGLLNNRYDLIRFYWARYLLFFRFLFTYVSLIYIFLVIANGRLFHIDSFSLSYSNQYIISFYLITETFFMFVFGYLALRNPAAFVLSSPEGNLEQRLAELVVPEEDKQIMRTPSFSQEQRLEYAMVLEKLINEKVYLNPDLSLKMLSEKTAIPSRQLSQFIKEHYGKTYKEYINHHRILFACELLVQQQHDPSFKMYSIALESGYNSESLFYKLFKEQMGLTPKQYQEANE